MNYLRLIIFLLLTTISCKEKLQESIVVRHIEVEEKPEIFLSFNYAMDKESFERTLEYENDKKSLLNGKFTLDLLDRKLYFYVTQKRGTIELIENESLRHLANPLKYEQELLKLFRSQYDIVEPLNLPIYSFYDNQNGIYVYNEKESIEHFRGKKTYNLKDYGFEQTKYFKAKKSSSNIVVLIGYSLSKSKQGIGQIVNPEKYRFNDNWQDLIITLNYFSADGFEKFESKIISDYDEFQNYKKSETERDNKTRTFNDSITSSNLKKI